MGRAQDEFGNAADWPATVAVEVLVREVDQSPFSCVERSYTTATFAASLYRAGLYQLHAAIDGTPIGHKPKLLQVRVLLRTVAHRERERERREETRGAANGRRGQPRLSSRGGLWALWS